MSHDSLWLFLALDSHFQVRIVDFFMWNPTPIQLPFSYNFNKPWVFNSNVKLETTIITMHESPPKKKCTNSRTVCSSLFSWQNKRANFLCGKIINSWDISIVLTLWIELISEFQTSTWVSNKYKIINEFEMSAVGMC